MIFAGLCLFCFFCCRRRFRLHLKFECFVGLTVRYSFFLSFSSSLSDYMENHAHKSLENWTHFSYHFRGRIPYCVFCSKSNEINWLCEECHNYDNWYKINNFIFKKGNEAKPSCKSSLRLKSCEIVHQRLKVVFNVTFWAMIVNERRNVLSHDYIWQSAKRIVRERER